MIDKYYEEELRYLYQSGKEFAQAHPDRAQYLDIDAVGDRDPSVERLFEGFAFLAARIREKLDDTFPELTEGLINLLWPQLLQEIPSLTIVQFCPRKGHLTETRTLPRGSLLLSSPVGPDSKVCRFSTTSSVPISPLILDSINKKVDASGKASLTLNFKTEPGVKWHNLDLDPLRLYIHAEAPTSLAVHELLTRHLVSSAMISSGKEFTSNNITLCPGGFSSQESLLLSDTKNFRSFALLMEYLIYPEKFFFVDIHGIVKTAFPPTHEKDFSLALYFDCDFPRGKLFDSTTFRLFCSPAVNMFSKSTEPLINTGKKAQYRVTADFQDRSSITHSIISVEGIDRLTSQRISYEPACSFKTAGKKNASTFSPHYCPGFDNRRELYLTLNGGTDGGSEENLSIEAWCTNGILPREELREGSISKPGRDFPDFCMFANITRPTLPFLPPTSGEYLWIFLSHLSSTYSSFSTAESLKTFLRLYDWSGSQAQARKIDAISDVSIKSALSPFEGGIVRGIELSISLQESGFIETGDINLFGEILREFFTHYVSINSFLELVIITRPSAKQFRWSTLRGARWPI